MDIFIDALLSGTPLAILAALVGFIWQQIYAYSRDRSQRNQAQQQLALEQQKHEHASILETQRFEHQRQLELLRFEYDQRRWREELSRDITLQIVEARIQENARLWQQVEAIALPHQLAGELTAKETRQLAAEIKRWRYDKGGYWPKK